MQVHRGTGAARVGAVMAALLVVACEAAGAPGGGGARDPRPAVDAVGVDPDAPALAAPTTPIPARTEAAAITAPPSPTGPPTPSPASATSPADPGPTLLGTFPPEGFREVSGVAASWHDQDVVWLLDDGPEATSVLAVRTDGAVLAEVTMAGVVGRDTEALSIAPCAAGDATPCLYVGDIGDNAAMRESVQVHRFPEPVPTDGDEVVDVATATFTLPGGPADAEAMVVGSDGLPILFTKRHGAADVLGASAFADGVLVDRGTLPLAPPAAPLQSLVTGVVATDASLHPSGVLLVRTYDHALVFTPWAAEGGELAGWHGVEAPVPYEPQGEAITWFPHGPEPTGWITVSEGSDEIWLTPAALA